MIPRARHTERRRQTAWWPRRLGRQESLEWTERHARGRDEEAEEERSMKAKEYPVIPDDHVVKRLEQELPGWYFEGKWIRRKFNTDGWPTTLMLVNAIGYLAEAGWHHPDLEVSWGKLWVKLMTHASNGITERDFELARKIEGVTSWKPAEGAALGGAPNKGVRWG